LQNPENHPSATATSHSAICALGQDLRINRRALQRWAAGDARDAPPTLRRDLARLVAARQDMLGALYRELSAS
jgi:hypothetical protein